MTPSDSPSPPALTRRALRSGSTRGATDGSVAVAEPPGPDEADAAASTSPDEAAAEAAASSPRALAWVDESALGTGAAAAPQGWEPPLVERWPSRFAWRRAALTPLVVVVTLALVYSATMLLWPLHAVQPQVEASSVTTTPAAAVSPAWPADGSAAVGVPGLGSPLASSGQAVPMASITKVVTALVVLDGMPLGVGESGPSYTFTSADRADYRATIASGESALPFPTEDALTQYQLLEGLLIGSAGNYADFLVAQQYPSQAAYVRAANEWLAAHALTGITVVDPSGISARNVATPAALISLGQQAMADPVIAEIVAKPSVELPGVGLVENTNALLGDPGVVGVKTGFLGRDYNLLTARDLEIGDTTVRAFVAVLGQDSAEARFAETRALLASLDAPLQPTVAVPAGTVVGTVTTLWGDPVQLVTRDDAAVILWNGGTSVASMQLGVADTADAREEGDAGGVLRVTGPLDAAESPVVLAAPVADPDPWWRLTHPLELLGLSPGA
ncbi:D-alanyl-D-alanine carboxypeptidase [Microbacterium limosum]|uniref:D-alanyl-D-alanine carboxypeptidase n=1 Tax=Microbacterium limosum TaxID=3079935 RepID=A0AAU0MHB4_9MICO|nr:D-alanyl-D-alanine carboxypeptidase [Microbacterium sp. Y20]WOQ69906.1 D-alanyl-D-alanine carboxypeptidase [Microbacterium sp. Y20]